MDIDDCVRLFYSGMEKLGPGDNEHTLKVLHLLPVAPGSVIVDAGCGTGRQTIALAKEIGSPIHAVDIYSFFLDELMRRAEGAGVSHLVQVHCMDMKDIASVFPRVNLLWSEGAAYNIGFANALRVWAPAVERGGFLVVSEMCWLRGDAPAEAIEFFRSVYPGMQTVLQNEVTVAELGYRLLATHLLPHEAWVDGYYDRLAPRARELLHHPDGSIRSYAKETLREIEVFESCRDSYGYVFFVLQRC